MKRRHLLSELRKKLKRANKEESDESSEEEVTHKQKRTTVMRGNKIAEKEKRTIELGWLHEGQQVRKQTGGGTRKLSVPKSATSNDIAQHALNLFFPDGISKKGVKLGDVSYHVCDFSASRIQTMQSVGETYEKEKPSGILRWYLSTKMKVSDVSKPKASGSTVKPKSLQTGGRETPSPEVKVSVNKLEASPTTQDFKTIQTEDRASSPHMEISHKPGLYPVIKGEVSLSREPLKISYSREVQSRYSDNVSTLTAFSRSQCIYTNTTDENDNPLDPDGVYDPLENGYKVSDISKGDKVYVQQSDTSCDDQEVQYEFPCTAAAESPDPYLILHHPNEVWGFEEGKLILGIVSHHHNNSGLSCEWFCDNEPVYSGGCLLTVEKPGYYHCKLKAVIQQEGDEPQEYARDSHPVQVMQVSDISQVTALIPRHQIDSNTCIAEQSTQVFEINVSDYSQESTNQQIEPNDISCTFTAPINHGSFGEVYKGTWKGAAVAVKRIRHKRGKRPDKLILNEANIHRQLAHKNIVKFIGTYMDESHVFIITEFVPGTNMEDKIYSGTDQVDRRVKFSVAIGVLEGVSYLHDQIPQIIHQDLKPANILLDTDLSPKVCDLGLAKTKSFGMASTTTSGISAVGTMEYMAPEILLNHGRSSASSDIWSLGVTFAEWFAFQEPWDLQNQDDDPAVYIRDCMLRKDLPPVLKTHKLPLLVPCMNYIPAERPTAVQLLRRLQCPSCSNDMLV